MARTLHQEISINGDEFAPGSLVTDPWDWHGTVTGNRMPGGPAARVIAIIGSNVYFGMALVTHLTVNADDPPINEFHGTGPLGCRSLAEVAEFLSRTEADVDTA